jgi:hypothetical protein
MIHLRDGFTHFILGEISGKKTKIPQESSAVEESLLFVLEF